MARKTKKEKEQDALDLIAQEVLDGKWGSGRERDILLSDAGHDPRKVQRSVARLRASQ